jgi:hypothetical protein
VEEGSVDYRMQTRCVGWLPVIADPANLLARADEVIE